jgi:putative DNA primase/helicase
MDKMSRDHDNSSMFINIEPWPEPVSPADLLNNISAIISKCIVLSDHEANAIALWVIFTYCIDAANVAPILNITSPEKRCGKSTLAALLIRLVYRPIAASNITPAALFRTIEKWSPTLVIDEGDSFIGLNEELRGILNSGHYRYLAYTIRCTGKDHEPKQFKTWCAKIIAGIGNIPETIADRSIIIRLRRKLANDKIQSLRRYSVDEINELNRKCIRFKEDFLEKIKNMNFTFPENMKDRVADNWGTLFSIAYLGGDDWVKRANEAAIALSKTDNELVSTGVELLQDIKNIFITKNLVRQVKLGLSCR